MIYNKKLLITAIIIAITSMSAMAQKNNAPSYDREIAGELLGNKPYADNFNEQKIQSEDERKFNMTIFDMKGRMVGAIEGMSLAPDREIQNFDLGPLPKGSYFINIFHKGRTISKKVWID